jgi:hypothetical protein
VLLPAILLTTVGLVRYFQGGGRLDRSGFGLSAPATVGEEFHAGAPLGASSGQIEVLAVRPVGVSGPVAVDLRLVLETGRAHLGSFRGPLPSHYVVLPLPSPGNGLKVNTGGPETVYSLDLRMIPTAAGVSRVKGVDVTYRSGALRERTARITAAICIDASSDWRDHVRDKRGGCAGKAP